jgi:hypothetical protein
MSVDPVPIGAPELDIDKRLWRMPALNFTLPGEGNAKEMKAVRDTRPLTEMEGGGVTIANPSSGGVIRCRLVASAKNAKTWSRGSGRDIEVMNVCSPGIGFLFDVEISLDAA